MPSFIFWSKMVDNSLSILNTTLVNLEQFWQGHLKVQQESGLSQAAYCRNHSLACSRFSYWKKKLTQPAVKLLPVSLTQSSVKADVLCTLVLTGGNELKIHDLTVLPTLISILS